MGIRFACHVCAHPLNVKAELAGKRGICPACSARFRIPLEDTDRSAPVEASVTSNDVAAKSDASSKSESAPEPNVVAGGVPGGAASSQVRSDDFPASILDTDEEGTWYVRPPSGGQYGPANTELLKQWIAEGRIAATALVWRDGWPQWREACEALPELVDGMPTPEPRIGSATVPPTGPNTGPNTGAVPVISDGKITDNPLPSLSESDPSKLAGNADVGTQRRRKNQGRTYLVFALAAISVGLIAALAFLLTQ